MQWQRIKRILIALLLSVFLPGLGQAYNRQPRKAILLSGAIPILYFASGILELLHHFAGLILHVVLFSGLSLFIVGDAVWVAGKPRDSLRPGVNTKLLYICLAVLVSFNLFAFSTDFYFDKVLGVRPYRIPSDSMTPTIIVGDRIITDMRHYLKHSPQRGDLVILRSPLDDSLQIKRVIAVGGDVLAGNRQSVSVDGERIQEPYLQPVPGEESVLHDPYDEYGPLRIPANQFFVMGDNRLHSFDSRQPRFGTVGIERIRGKPLFVYWSGDRKRIGKAIR